MWTIGFVCVCVCVCVVGGGSDGFLRLFFLVKMLLVAKRFHFSFNPHPPQSLPLALLNQWLQACRQLWPVS